MAKSMHGKVPPDSVPSRVPGLFCNRSSAIIMKTNPCLAAWHPCSRLGLCLVLSLVWIVSLTPALGQASTPGPQNWPFVQAQFESIGDLESIPEGVVTALAQDARGLIWIGTQKGLIRYDGYRFRRFIHNANDPGSLAGDYVYALWAARDGRLWVGTNSDGISIFDPASERFEHARHDPARAGSLGAGRISALLGDAAGGVWIATDQGLDYLPKPAPQPGSQPGTLPGTLPAKARQFIHYRHQTNQPGSLLDDHVHSLLFDRNGILWVGTSTGLQRMHRAGKGFEAIATGIDVRSLFQAQDGKIWLGTRQHGAAWLGDNNTPHWLPRQTGNSGLPLSNAWVNGFAQVQADQLWLATDGGGINIVAASDGQVLQHLRHDPTLSTGLALDSVVPMLLDRSGLLWVGTWGGGLQRMNPHNKMVRMLRRSQVLPSGLSHSNIRSILELANGQILFGSEGNGIDIFDRRHGRVGGYRADGPSALPDASINSLLQTADGSLWAGTQQVGVIRLAPGSSHWQTMAGVQGQQINSLFQSRDGSIWAATTTGVARYQMHSDRFVSVPDHTGQPMQSRVLSLLEDSLGRIWAGSGHGLWVLNSGSRGFYPIHPEPERADSLCSDFIGGLLLDSQQRLWVATDKGLQRLAEFDGKVARFEHVSPNQGQARHSMGENIMQDQHGKIWSDIAIIDPLGMKMHALTKADGIDVGASAAGAYTKTRDGLLLFGGTQGVAIIDPGLFQVWNDTPPVVVTELQINGKPVAPGELGLPASQAQPHAHAPAQGQGHGQGQAASLTLSPAQRNFTLEFSALDYSEPKKNRYQYRLLGYERDWIDTDYEHRRAAYGNLWPGEYTLQIRGSNRVGQWSSHVLSIPLRVLPAFWQTWWFLLLALLVIGSAGYGGYRWRTQRLQALIAARTADILYLGEIGQELTSTLDTEQAFERVWQQVRARLDTGVFLIGIYDPHADQIVYVYEIENNQRQPVTRQDMSESDRPAVWCIRERRELITDCNADLLNYVSTILPPSTGRSMETLVYLPLILQQQVIGCLSVQSLRQNAYDKGQLKFLRMLANYAAIALANSTAHGALTHAHQRLKETQQQMVLQEKMAGLGTLTAGVAHEINNPTNFVHVAAQIQALDIAEFQQFVSQLIEPDADPEIMPAFARRFSKLNENINIMLLGTERIKHIVRDLRAFSRLDEGGRKSVHLSECLNSTLNLVRTSWLEQVEFHTDFKDDPEIECWPALLNQVFMNLLINGCQAIAEKPGAGRGQLGLILQFSPDQTNIEVRFQDNGIGMDYAIQARILEPFFTTKEVGCGTGLGLSIAFGIVQKHGGTLSFSSSPGVGSEFVVSLPLPCSQHDIKPDQQVQA
jgi:signal transduction histidine kinase/ligand-binding sensor domain-containing protein